MTVNRQVLAEPEAGLSAKTWARLADGTPLVTAETRGKGVVVLFHVSADTIWSNLPISGLFVDMLRRICALAGEGAASPTDDASRRADVDERALPPIRTLDGFGALGAPPAFAKPIGADFSGQGGPEHPPGFYGAGDAYVAVETLDRADDARRPGLRRAGPCRSPARTGRPPSTFARLC